MGIINPPTVPPSISLNQIYTGTDINQSIGQNVSQTKNFVLPTITSADLVNATYVLIEATISGNTNCLDGSSVAQIKAQQEYVGGTYADITGYQDVCTISAGNAGYSHGMKTCSTVRFYVAVTANHKAYGMNIQLFTFCSTTNRSGASSAITNIQTLIWTV